MASLAEQGITRPSAGQGLTDLCAGQGIIQPGAGQAVLGSSGFPPDTDLYPATSASDSITYSIGNAEHLSMRVQKQEIGARRFDTNSQHALVAETQSITALRHALSPDTHLSFWVHLSCS